MKLVNKYTVAAAAILCSAASFAATSHAGLGRALGYQDVSVKIVNGAGQPANYVSGSINNALIVPVPAGLAPFQTRDHVITRNANATQYDGNLVYSLLGLGKVKFTFQYKVPCNQLSYSCKVYDTHGQSCGFLHKCKLKCAAQLVSQNAMHTKLRFSIQTYS